MVERLEGVARSRRGVILGAMAALLAASSLTVERKSTAAKRRNKKGRNGNRSSANAHGSGGAGGAGGNGGDVVIPTD